MNTAAMDLRTMQAGFADPVHEAQATFRCVLDALAHPGRIFRLPRNLAVPAGLSTAQAAMLLSLVDADTSVYLAPECRVGGGEDFLRFHCGCPLSSHSAEAQFVVLKGLASIPVASDLRLGEPAYPDRSASLLIEVAELAEGGPICLRGPGIADRAQVSIAGWTALSQAFFAQNRQAFPLGVDVVLSCGESIMGLPRTTLVEV